MEHYEAGSQSGVPPRSWWKITASAPSKARAQEFYSKWLDTNTEGRRAMEGIAVKLQQHGTGYRNDEFQRELMRERQLLGTDQR